MSVRFELVIWGNLPVWLLCCMHRSHSNDSHRSATAASCNRNRNTCRRRHGLLPPPLPHNSLFYSTLTLYFFPGPSLFRSLAFHQLPIPPIFFFTVLLFTFSYSSYSPSHFPSLLPSFGIIFVQCAILFHFITVTRLSGLRRHTEDFHTLRVTINHYPLD